ncbi:Gfo/Idh/MocA family oxidoreductase [bacterium]|nr:Gfo/Idh/MocA family oxidoreductase [bacterium]
MKLKVGIIGAGGIAQYAHIPSYQKNSDIEVVAISDTNQEKLKTVSEKFKIPLTFSRWDEMLSEDLDIISICTPSVFHFPQSVKAMELGKHVLCEKPICISSKELKEIFKVSSNTGMKFMGAMHKRFSGEAQVLKKIIKNGHLGKIYYTKASWVRRRGIPYPGSWFTNKSLSGGGTLMDIGVHAIDLLIYLTGISEPEFVIGATYNKFKDIATDGGWPPPDTRKGDKYTGIIDVEELATGFIKFKGGETLFAEACWAGNLKTDFSIDILGTKGGARIVNPGERKKNSLTIYGEIEGVISDFTPTVPITNPFQEEIEHFVDCIKNDRMPLTSREELLTVMEIIEGIYHSATSNS